MCECFMNSHLQRGAEEFCDADDLSDLYRSIKILAAGRHEQRRPIVSSINLSTTIVRQISHATWFEPNDNSHANALADKIGAGIC